MHKMPHSDESVLWNHREPWSDEDIATLRFWWGELSPREIAKKLYRKVVAIELKARELGLGSPNQDGTTVRGLSQETGYSEHRIRSAAKMLGITIKRCFPNAGRGAPRWKSTKWKRTKLNEDERDRILDFLAKYPDGQYIKAAPDPSKWGVAGRPPACLRCKEVGRTHYSQGYCRRCYPYTLTWGNGGRPAACVSCNTTEGHYHGKGLCATCYRIKWGIAKRPPACLRCGTTEKQHYGGGYCAHCYKKVFTWGVGGRPEVCRSCSSNKGFYHGQGLCTSCYKKRLKLSKAAAA